MLAYPTGSQAFEERLTCPTTVNFFVKVLSLLDNNLSVAV